MNIKILTLLALGLACKSKEPTVKNNAPTVKLEASLIKVNPFTYKLSANANDTDFDNMAYSWDFGDGKKKIGNQSETVTINEGQKIIVTVKVTDGKSPEVESKIELSADFQIVTINENVKYQTMEGFGGFGAQNVYWSNGPFTSARFVDDLVNDLGITIARDDIPTNFEIENDNNDPLVTDLSKYNINKVVAGHHAPFGQRILHLKALKEAGVTKFIASVWSPAPWMKWNNRIDNGTNANSAPNYNRTPNATSNQLKVENYEEFAEMCVAYCKIFKREIGIDLYGLGVQNEPRFSQSYQSCLYDGEALNELIKVVGRRFAKEGITAKLFAPEDVGYLDGVKSMTLPMLNDTETRSYVGIVATHGYALDGIAPGSTDAQTWKTMYNWGATYNIPHWMTETSGYKNSHDGAIDLAKAMYTAINFGNISAWVFWSLSTEKLDEYSLMNDKGEKSKRYYVSKHFYKYIKPGSVRIEASNTGDVLSLAFKNGNKYTLVMINIGNSDKAVKVNGGANLYKTVKTSVDDNTVSIEDTKNGGLVIVPARGLVTLYSE